MNNNAITVIQFGRYLVHVCPTERIAVRQRLLGHTAIGPDAWAKLELINTIFPGAVALEFRGIKK